MTSLLASACSSSGASPTEGTNASRSPASTATAAASPSDPSVVVVSARDNLFGAGHSVAPAPAGGGTGFVPAAWPLPSGAQRTVTFQNVTGEVTGIVTVLPMNGAAGDHNAPVTATMTGGRGTDVESFGGIAGLVDRHNEMFLAGVFLSDAEPADPAPDRLDFTDREEFDVLAPAIAQTFFIGDGGSRRFRVPAGATRLFLGFVDAFFWQGPPGYYGNNAGELRVKIIVSVP